MVQNANVSDGNGKFFFIILCVIGQNVDDINLFTGSLLIHNVAFEMLIYADYLIIIEWH